ncbi:hypothetical protein Tco_1398462 [Tanacetum coccineum]
MTTPIEKRNNNKFCEFHGEVGHTTDECMHLRRQIEELIKAGKLSHVIKELKQGSGKDQPKAIKKGETSRKDKPLAILMFHEECSFYGAAILSHSNARWSLDRKHNLPLSPKLHKRGSELPRANNCNRLYPNKGQTDGVVRITQVQPGHIYLET